MKIGTRNYIEINRNTLPKDRSKVRWKTVEEDGTDIWKQGTFSENAPTPDFPTSEDLFTVGFENTSSDWDDASDVLFWEYIEE